MDFKIGILGSFMLKISWTGKKSTIHQNVFINTNIPVQKHISLQSINPSRWTEVSLSFHCLVLHQSLLPKDPMMLNGVPVFNRKDAEITGVSLNWLTWIWRKNNCYIDGYSRKIIELGPITPITPLLRAPQWPSDSLRLKAKVHIKA